MVILLLSVDLVEKFFHGIAMRSSRLVSHHGQIRMVDVPEVRRDLVARNCDLLPSGLRTPGQPSVSPKLEVKDVGNLRREVFDVGVPVAIVSGGRRSSFVSLSRRRSACRGRCQPCHEFIADAAVKASRKPRSRFAPPGASGTITSTPRPCPGRRPIRPALSIRATGSFAGAPDFRARYHILQRRFFRSLNAVGVKLPQLLHSLLEVRGLIRSCLTCFAWPCLTPFLLIVP